LRATHITSGSWFSGNPARIEEDSMDARDFDRMARSVSTRMPRRTLAGLLGLSLLSVAGLAEAKKNNNKNKDKKKNKKVKRNDFGCVSVGKFCKNDGQCCSGICQGKKDNKKCKAHDQSTCQSGQDLCLGNPVGCTTTSGSVGQCGTTTGNAPYCFDGGPCSPCSKDSDCEAIAGAGAACIVCVTECFGENPQSTACVGLSPL